MPRCQRTFRYLSPAVRGTWTCPHCPDRETYDVVRERAVWEYARWAQGQAITDFGLPSDANWRFLLLEGAHPECVRETADRRYDIYLAAGSDPYQQRLQIGHELFHRVAGEGRTFHWSHEMLACLFSVRLLESAGHLNYANRMRYVYGEDAERCPASIFFAATPWNDAAYPEGYYGRAFVTGVDLEGIVGYGALCRLARTLTSHSHETDISAWLQTLNLAERNRVASCLTLTI